MQVPLITHIGSDSRPGTEKEKWTLCGSLCTTADVIARGAEFNDLQKGDRIVFHRTGAYSVYEGISMFLSRDLPSVYMLDSNNYLRLMRSRIETARFNMQEGIAENDI